MVWYRSIVLYEELNDRVECDQYPIHRTWDLLRDLEGSKYFTSIDLNCGFFKFLDKKEVRYKLAFTSVYWRLQDSHKVLKISKEDNQRIFSIIIQIFVIHIYIYGWFSLLRENMLFEDITLQEGFPLGSRKLTQSAWNITYNAIFVNIKEIFTFLWYIQTVRL